MRALVPLILFVVMYLGLGMSLHLKGVEFAFYQFPSPVLALIAFILSLFILKGKTQTKIDHFIRGMGNPNILTMCAIYLFAGAFSTLATKLGSVDAVVNLGLDLIPSSLILPGFFLISAIVSMAMGTSMGTIAAVAPIAVGVSESFSVEITYLIGAVISGAMFGDNLSFISDTTIAATKSLEIKMKDKFKENFKITFPIFLLTLVLFYFIGMNATSEIELKSYEMTRAIPYFLILTLALIGVEVFTVLTIGIISLGILGFITTTDFSFLTFTKYIYEGFTSMQEIFLLSLFIGGISELTKFYGGNAYLRVKLESLAQKLSSGKKSAAEFVVSSLAVLMNLFTANNTIAIILSGETAKEIAIEHDLRRQRVASLLDIFACVTQGLIPYGAQLLLASQISKVSPLDLMFSNFYCLLLGGGIFISLAVKMIQKK